MDRNRPQRLLASFLAVGILSACSGGSDNPPETAAPAAATEVEPGGRADGTTDEVADSPGESDGEPIEVEKNLFSVEVTLPRVVLRGRGP